MKYLFIILVAVVMLVPVGTPEVVQAQTGSGVSIPNPIKCDDINCLVAQVIRYILGTIAIVATLMFIWGGFMMLTSGGNAERIKKSKETLAWAAIGIVVIMLSWAIIRFVLGSLINTSPSSTSTPTLPTGCCVIGNGCTTTTAGQCTSSNFTEGQTCVGGTTCQ